MLEPQHFQPPPPFSATATKTSAGRTKTMFRSETLFVSFLYVVTFTTYAPVCQGVRGNLVSNPLQLMMTQTSERESWSARSSQRQRAIHRWISRDTGDEELAKDLMKVSRATSLRLKKYVIQRLALFWLLLGLAVYAEMHFHTDHKIMMLAG